MMIAMNCFCNKDVKEQNIKLCLLLPEVLTQETSDRAESGFESGIIHLVRTQNFSKKITFFNP